MARLDVEISDELSGWIQDEVKQSKSTKVAFVTAILEAARQGPQPASEPPGEVRTDTGPDSDADPDALRKVAVTLYLFFKRYLGDHPSHQNVTDEDEEALDERWEFLKAIRDRELAK